METFEGKAVLITGASSGVGFAAAEAFARAGADVALTARSRPGLERAARRVRAQGRRAVIVPADVTDRPAVDDAVKQAIDGLGAIHGVILCAASTVFGAFDEVPPEDFDRVVEVSFLGAVNVVRSALPEVERNAGVIVAVGSLMTQVPLPTFSSYAAAKHAERGFLNSLRVELKARRSPVEIAQVHPGSINTPVWENTKSVTGYLPRRPPEGYPPQQVADALVAAALKPTPERFFGAEAKAIQLLFDHARPLGDLLLTVVHHYYRSGRRPGTGMNALWEAAGEGIANDGMLQRPSVTQAVRLATSPVRALLR